MKRIQYLIFAGIIFLSLAFPLNALADDEVPPTATELPVTSNDEPTATETPTNSTDEASATEVPIIVDEEIPAQIPPEPDSVSETLSQLPQNTQVIITNTDGSVEPLATQAAADAIITGDPIWCPEGIAPQAGVGGCTDPGAGNSNYDPTSLDSLLNYLQSNQPSQAGVIWIEKNYDSSVNDATATGFSIDGSSLTTMSGFALTIQGGWSGTSGDTSVDHTDKSVFNGDYLHVENWAGDVTINDILITGVSSPDVALSVDTTGSIAVNNSDVNGNGDIGAYLDNSNGSGNVKVSRSKFNTNQSVGIMVNSSGTILVNDVSANDNQIIGAFVNNNFNSSTAGVSFTGTNTFSRNDAFGLVTISNGTIYLNSVSAMDNGTPLQPYDGALLDTLQNIVICQGTFSGNSGYGVEASLLGTLVLSNVNFEGNQAGGYRAFGGGGVSINPDLCPVEHGSSKRMVESGLPLKVVTLSSGGDAEFDCESFSGTVLVLPNQNEITFMCPILGTGSLSEIKQTDFSADLPEGVEYVSGMLAGQSPDGSDKALSGLVVISFLIPEEMKSADLAILYLNHGNWIDLENASFDDGRTVINGGYFTGDGHFEARTNFSGSFILVKK